MAVLGAVEVVDAEELLGLRDAALGDRDRLVLLVELVVVVGDERPSSCFGSMPSGFLPGFSWRREPGELRVEVGGLLGRAGDDQRRARLVDQDVVDLVDDREGVQPDLRLPSASQLSQPSGFSRPPCWTFSSSDVAMLSRR